jgi:hypothetical protein
MSRIWLTLLGCVALLMTQMVGLHLHASMQPDQDGLHASHIHGADPDGDDHSSDVDVSVVEFGALWAKLAPMMIGSFMLSLPEATTVHQILPVSESSLPSSAASHWRPPLRAPPPIV